MKTNPLTFLLNKAKKGFCGLLNLYRKHPSLIRIVFTILALFSFFVILSIALSSCKTPATLTNNESHRTRDSTRHASIQRIETHDTIIIGTPKSPLCLPLKGEYCSLPLREGQGGSKSPFKGDLEGQVLVRISDRKITIRDTVFVSRTDTLLRTQTITQKERYIPPFYRFCTISFVTFVSFVTLAFSIHLLLRYLKIRSPT